MKKQMIILLCLIPLLPAMAKVDLVTLPKQDSVQVTIYNSADLTLVRDSRSLTLKEGLNRLQFSWANTLIDPTSLEMRPLTKAGDIDVFNLTYPPRTRNVGIWSISSKISGKAPMRITYLTSGLSWRAFYMGTLAPDEKTMRLQGYVRVANNSGEDYDNAQTRLIVGKVHLIDQIATLAQRQYPYGSPQQSPELYGFNARERSGGRELKMAFADTVQEALLMPAAAPKEIKKEGLSEYFLYTIEGTESIPHQWAKRLPSFDVADVPVVNLYKYEERRYGPRVMRFLSFKNDKEHELGETPIPGGMLEVSRKVNKAGNLSYEGRSSFKYIPVDEDVELNLGAVENVMVEPEVMDFKTDHYVFNKHGDVSGWDEIRTWRIKVKNTRDIPVKVEIKRNFRTPYWEIKNSGNGDTYEKVDKDTIKYTLELPPRSNRELHYVATIHKGRRAE